MPKSTIFLCTALCILLSCSLASATTLSDTLIKTFKTIELYPKEVTATITLATNIPPANTGTTEEAVMLAYKLQAKMVSVFKKGGWQEDDQLQIDPLDAGLVELKIDNEMELGEKDSISRLTLTSATVP